MSLRSWISSFYRSFLRLNLYLLVIYVSHKYIEHNSIYVGNDRELVLAVHVGH